ncbi:MAG: hypothetical protein ACREMO_11130 [Gemmatimonadales bacterium]
MEATPARTESDREADARFLWRLFGLIGVLFTAMGLVNLTIAWYPIRIGTPEWEFGAIAAFLDATPSFTLGLCLLLGSALAAGRRGRSRMVVAVLLAMAFLVLAAGVLYATTAPIALSHVNSAGALGAVKKALAKSGVEIIVLPVGLLWLGIVGWRASSRGLAR